MALFPRNLVTNPARTAADRKLRNRLVIAAILVTVATYGLLFLTGLLPESWRGTAALVVLLVSFVLGNLLISWRRADWENRATRSKDEARDREQRRKALGG